GRQSKEIQEKDKSFHRIIVQDNGIGFDSKYVNEIFMVFKRLHSYHEYEGSGVGLSICKKIIERHNGNITAVSKIGTGSSFIVELPVAKLEKALNMENKIPSKHQNM
ncbi:MAG TPA: ATP-binding protein, partial [Candidatus Nitrosocosmicus sp.]